MRIKMLQASFVMVLSLTLASIGWVAQPLAQELVVDLAGKVVDSSGKGISGAKINLMESRLTTTTDAQGNFLLQGTVAGVVKRASLPGVTECQL